MYVSFVESFFSDSNETYKTFPRCIITEFECKVDVQNREIGWIRVINRFLFKIVK